MQTILLFLASLTFVMIRYCFPFLPGRPPGNRKTASFLCDSRIVSIFGKKTVSIRFGIPKNVSISCFILKNDMFSDKKYI